MSKINEENNFLTNIRRNSRSKKEMSCKKMKEDETQIKGYKITPGRQTIKISPLAELTRDVCLKCLQPTDKKIIEIKNEETSRHTVCDWCFRNIQSGKEEIDIYSHVVRKDLVAFFRKKQTR